jgi:hypothetical protein
MKSKVNGQGLKVKWTKKIIKAISKTANNSEDRSAVYK